jgi:hypothetical protein
MNFEEGKRAAAAEIAGGVVNEPGSMQQRACGSEPIARKKSSGNAN